MRKPQRKRIVVEVIVPRRVDEAKYRKARQRGDQYKERAKRYRGERDAARAEVVKVKRQLVGARSVNKQAISDREQELKKDLKDALKALHVERVRHDATTQSLAKAEGALRLLQADITKLQPGGSSIKGSSRSSLVDETGKGGSRQVPGNAGNGKRQR